MVGGVQVFVPLLVGILASCGGGPPEDRPGSAGLGQPASGGDPPAGEDVGAVALPALGGLVRATLPPGHVSVERRDGLVRGERWAGDRPVAGSGLRIVEGDGRSGAQLAAAATGVVSDLGGVVTETSPMTWGGAPALQVDFTVPLGDATGSGRLRLLAHEGGPLVAVWWVGVDPASRSGSDALGLLASVEWAAPEQASSADADRCAPPPLAEGIHDLDAEMISEVLTAHGGCVVLMELYASWCAPCRVVAPKVAALEGRYGPQGFTVLRLSTDKDLGMLQAWRTTEGMTAPTHRVLPTAGPALAAGIARTGARYPGEIPYFALFDRDGGLVVEGGVEVMNGLDAELRRRM